MTHGQASIEEQLVKLGFKTERQPFVSGRTLVVRVATCNQCGAHHQASYPPWTPPDQVALNFQHKGWTIKKGRMLCRLCSNPPRPEKPKPPEQNPPTEKRTSHMCGERNSPFKYKGYWLSHSGSKVDLWSATHRGLTPNGNRAQKYHGLNTTDLETAKRRLIAYVDERESQQKPKEQPVEKIAPAVHAMEPTYSEVKKIEDAIAKWWNTKANRWDGMTEQQVADKIGVARAKVAFVREDMYGDLKDPDVSIDRAIEICTTLRNSVSNAFEQALKDLRAMKVGGK